MSEKDEELKALDDLFDAENPEDMEDFMNMLDSIDMGDGPFSQEKEDKISEETPAQKADTESKEEEVSEFDMSELDLFNADFLNMQSEETSDESIKETADAIGIGEEESDFLSMDEDDILKLLDAVGEETAAISDETDVQAQADESVGEIADILAGLSEEETAPDIEPLERKKKVQGEGIFKKLKEKFRKEPTEEELFAMEQEEAEVLEWEKQEKEKKRIKKEEAQAKKMEKKAEADRKKQQKAEKKAARNAVKAEKKAAKKAKKAEKAQAKGPIPKSQLVPVKPLVAFVIIGLALSVVFVTFSDYRYYSASIDDSKEMFIHQQYKEAYEMLLGLDIRQKDEKFFDQVRTVRVVHKELESYNNYVKVSDYEMALKSLVKGIGKYDSQLEHAKELKLEKEMYNLYGQMLTELTGRFAMTEQEARDLYALKDKEAYHKQIEQVARDAAIRDGILEPVEVAEISE